MTQRQRLRVARPPQWKKPPWLPYLRDGKYWYNEKPELPRIAAGAG